MGIASLLQELKTFAIPLHFVFLACFGSVAIVDMSAWMHFAFNCLSPDALVATVLHDDFSVLKSMLQDWILRAYMHGVALRFVCEQNYTPFKKRKENEAVERANLRATFHGQSDSRAKKREKDLRTLCERTVKMLYALVTVAHVLGAQCVLAPVEADGQLAFLARLGFLILCNDSDVLALCHADRVGRNTARFVAIVAHWSLTGPKKKKTKGLSEARLYDIRQLVTATAPSFLSIPSGISMVGALSTCDYVNISGIGVAKASEAVNDHRDFFSDALEKVLSASRAASETHEDLRRDARRALQALTNPVIFHESDRRLCLLDGTVLDPAEHAHLMDFPPDFATFTADEREDWFVFPFSFCLL